MLSSPKDPASPYWCNVCSLDLQSSQALTQHKLGRKHKKLMYRMGLLDHPPESSFPSITDEEELFQGIVNGKYRNVVVLTGAGVSTAAGIPDYRSSGGFFESLKNKFNGRFPGIEATPEILFSRNFVKQYPDVWENELLPMKQEIFRDLKPTITHKFCAYLYHQGWLKRIYTQNIDGLHLHPSLSLPDEKVVECHGSVKREDFVLYGDPLPKSFFELAGDDFRTSSHENNDNVDLVLVFGTSLQVAPFCGLPNKALKGCTRVLVNRRLRYCYRNSFSTSRRRGYYDEGSYGCVKANTTNIGSRKNVQLQSLWLDEKAKKKWRQLMVEDDCDKFVERFLSFANVIDVDDLCNS